MALRDLRVLLRDAVKLDRTQSDPVVATRNAVGIAIPLGLAELTSTAAAGLAPTIGALQTGLADRPGPYRLRALRMFGCALVAGLTSALAVFASRNDVVSVVLLLVLAFVAGLLVTGGPAATQVGIAGTAAAIVLGHLPQPPGAAVHVGLLVLVGGAGQAVLAIAAWPLGRHQPERHALAGLYRELASAARRPGGTGAGPQATATVESVRKTLYGLGHDHGPSVEAYRVLLDQAERIRREIVVIAALIERLAGRGRSAGAGIDAGMVRAALGSCGDVLDAVADALARAHQVATTPLTVARDRMRRAVTRLEAADDLTARAAAARLRALAGQLRAVLETTDTGASEGRRPEAVDVPGGPRLRDPIAALRANLTPDSQVLRHAVRTALMVAGTDLVVRLAGYQHGYWVALTVLVVLRPDFSSTFQRAVLRVIGTVIGLVLATELLQWIPGGNWYRIALIALCYFGVRLAGPGNVGLLTVALSALVVVLLAVDGVAPQETLVDRSIATVIGGALALGAVLLLPVWERDRLPARLADLLAAYRAYLDVLADPSSQLGDRQRARAAARLARTNALASLELARNEPVVRAEVVDLGESVLANSHRVVHALMTIDSVRATIHHAGLPTRLQDLLHGASHALAAAADAVRAGRPPTGAASVRPLQDAVFDALRAAPQQLGGPEVAGALADATDRLANAVDTLVAELRRRLAAERVTTGSTVAP